MALSGPSRQEAAPRGTSLMTERTRALGGSVQWLTEKEAAALLGTPFSTFHKNWRRWGVPGIKLGGRLKFLERDLEHWVEQQRVTGAE